MTHEDRRRRRREMVKFVRERIRAGEANSALNDAAGKYKVHAHTVRLACLEAGLRLPRQISPNVGRPAKAALKVLADLIEHPEWTLAAIGVRHDLTRQRVHQIKQDAAKHGVLAAVECRVREAKRKAGN